MQAEYFLILVPVCIVNVLLLLWFIGKINEIASSLRTIAKYSRRTALALPLTTGQAKLINASFTAIDLIAILEKQGAKLRVVAVDVFGGASQNELKIDHSETVDPEVLKLAFAQDWRIIEILTKRTAS